MAVTEPPWWALATFFAIAAALVFWPAVINLLVARFFGRQPAITSVVVTYFFGLYAMMTAFALAMRGPSKPDAMPIDPPPPLEAFRELAAMWVYGFYVAWPLHVGYILLGAAGAWAGLALRRRAARRRAEAAARASDGA